MLFLFALLFKIYHFDRINSSFHHKKQIKGFYLETDCGDQKLDYQNQRIDKNGIVDCEDSNKKTTVYDSNFINIHMHAENWPHQWSHLMVFKHSDATIRSCTFDNIQTQNEIFDLAEDKSDNRFYFYDNYVKNCYHESKEDRNIIKSYYYHNYIERNTFTFDANLNHNCRVLYAEYNTGIRFIRNTVINGYNPRGSVLQSYYTRTNSEGLEISHCKFTNCIGSTYSVIEIQQLAFNIKFTNLTIDNTKNVGDLVYILPNSNSASYKMEFVDCKFSELDSTGQGGGIGWHFDYGGSTFELVFQGTTFEHLRYKHSSYGGGAICVGDGTHKVSLSINECHFNDISANSGAGGAIYFFSMEKSLTIKKSDFKNTFMNGRNGGAIYINYKTGPTPVLIDGCTFEQTSAANGGSIYIENFENCETSNINIINCGFKSTESTTNGNSIMIAKSFSNVVSINNCKFEDCGKNHLSFTVKLNVVNLNFQYNTITFSNEGKSCGCIQLDTIGDHTFRGNTFKNAKYDSTNSNNWVSAGIYCANSQNADDVYIEDNVFENIVGTNQGRCIQLSNIIYNKIRFKNNTIQKCQIGGFFIKFGFTSQITQFTIERLILNHNNLNGCWDDGAGCTPPVWIESKNGNTIYPFTLNFKDCIFEGNTNIKKGGGIRFGECDDLIKTKVIFSNCHFTDNYAQESGGAISVVNDPGCEMSDCVFIRNRSDNGCGAIFFQKGTAISINRCQFEECSGKETNAININNKNNVQSLPDVTIFKCTFSKCGEDYFVVRIETNVKSIKISNCTIDFLNEASKTAGGVYLSTDKVTFLGNIFKNMKNTAIRLYTNLENRDVLELIENTFTACTQNTVIDIENALTNSPVFRGNVFDLISLEHPLISFKIKDEITSLTFDNNRFSNFEMNCEFGGIGLDICHETPSTSLQLSFNDCTFSNNNNNYHGSSISCDSHQNDGNLELFVQRCYFEKNHGECPSIYANIEQDILINECKFNGNTATSDGLIHVIPDFKDKTETKSVLITNCNFQKNQQTKTSSIYIAPGSKRTICIESCVFDDEIGSIYLDNIKNMMELRNNTFRNINKNPALVLIHPKGSNVKDQITIEFCTFDACNGLKNKCFDLFTYSKEFIFRHSIIQNNLATGYENYIGQVNCNDRLPKLEFENVSFLNNACDSLYGGGVGLQFGNIDDLTFTNCKFIGNSAKQNTDKSRPTQDADQVYYNGDGGAIQLGYICSMNQFDITFDECEFRNNRARRHGGAIAIQTIKDVYILDCTFEDNSANYNFDSSSSSADLLVDNHYHKKDEGRGGAIYINPSFTYMDDTLGCEPPSTFFVDITIQRCNFIKNTGFDGYGIYIEGDNLGSPINLEENNFLNNYNESNYIGDDALSIYGAVIATEVCNLDEKQVANDNTFKNDNPEIKVHNLICVDHYGNTASPKFTESAAFSQSSVLPSHYFTQSSVFSNSLRFSSSSGFTETNAFSNSDEFSQSKQFAQSDCFSKSQQFSSSDAFSSSFAFSNSETFSSKDEESSSSTISSTTDEEGDDSVTETSSSTTDEEGDDSVTETSSSTDEEGDNSVTETSSSTDEEGDDSVTETSSSSNKDDDNSEVSSSSSNEESDNSVTESSSSNNKDDDSSVVSSSSNKDEKEPTTSGKNEEDSNPTNIIDIVDPGSTQDKSSKSIKLPLIIGLIIGLLILAALIVLIIIFVIRRRKQETESENTSEPIEVITQNSYNQERGDEYINPLFNNPAYSDKDPFQEDIDEDSNLV